MYFVYVLRSKKDSLLYTGFTDNVSNRLKKHNSGQVFATKDRRPFELIYVEGGLNKTDALHREIYLKTAWGKKYIKNRLKNYLNNYTATVG
ncbi:MAG TPA: GIY-YIG nuclease family protein [Patescibacteria group bacterium]|nr:GIY-YIG nuclease family protein [Patescibacteria group bacterium]